MNIYQATKEAMAKGMSITRPWNGDAIIVTPTNGPECCLLELSSRRGEKLPGRCWNPKADDLMADDWELTERTWKEGQPFLSGCSRICVL